MTELLSKRITIDANICHGKPTIRDLRYPVENILEWLSSGMSTDDILTDYEDLEKEDILAVSEFLPLDLPRLKESKHWRHIKNEILDSIYLK
ncbi:MAG: DUF433 domain-containing protein [Methylococcales bacterium]